MDSLKVKGDAMAVVYRHAKNKRDATVTLHPNVAEQLEIYLGRPTEERGEPISPEDSIGEAAVHGKDNKGVDMEAARSAWFSEASTDDQRARREQSDFLRYEASDGTFADFHANRHQFVTLLHRYSGRIPR